jgi:fibronectin type 3 domain-containing protein
MLRYLLLLMLLLIAGQISVSANTVSSPVSVVIPSGMEGELVSRPVSVAVPSGLEGQILSRPVSVAVPSGLEGQILSRPLTVSVQTGNLVEPDLLGSWQMEGDWRDTSGNDNHAAGVNGPIFSAVRAEGSWSGAFNGSNRYLDAGNISAFNTAPQITLEAWIKPTAAQRGPIIDKYNIGVEYQADGSLRMWIRDTAALFPEAATTEIYPVNADWLHVVAVYKANQSMELYVNGQLKATTMLATEVDQSYTPSNLFIGKSNHLGGLYFAGLIDHVSIYQRALSASEVSDRYNYLINSSFPPAEPSVIAAPLVTADNPLTLSGTREVGTAIWINGVEKVPYDEVATTWQTDVALSYGPNLLSIAAKNQNGIFSKAHLISPILDNQPPSVTGVTPDAGELISNNQPTIVVNFADTYSAVDYSLTTGEIAYIKDSAGLTVDGSWTSPSANSAHFTPSELLADGLYTLTLVPTDDLGNAAVDLFTSQFEVDATPPALPAVVEAPTLVGHSATLQGTMPLDAVSLLISSTGGVVGQVSYPQPGQWSVELSNLPAGVVTLNLVAVDAAGNRSETLALNLPVDLTAPAVPVIDPVTSPTGLAIVELTGHKDAGSYLYLDGHFVTSDFAGETWAVTLDLAEGENQFVLEAVDAVGNVSDSVFVTLIYDTQGPTLVSATPAVNAFVSDLGNIDITLTDTYSAIDYAASLATASLRDSLGNEVVAGSWSTDNLEISYDLPQGETLPGDTYTLNLTPVDDLGNERLVAYTFTVDQTAPQATGLIMTPTSPHKAETVSFKVEFDEAMDRSISSALTLSGPSGDDLVIRGDNDVPINVDDDFDGVDGSLPDPMRWFSSRSENGTITINEVKNNKLQLLANQGRNYLNSNWEIAGEFDIQIDFSKMSLGDDWMGLAGVIIYFSDYYLQIYQGIEGSEGVRATIWDGTTELKSFQGISSSSMRFKVSRDADDIAHLFYSPDAQTPFAELLSGFIGAENIRLSLVVGSGNTKVVGGYFDNFKVASGTLVWPAGGENTGSWIDSDTWQGQYSFPADLENGTYRVSVSDAQDIAGNQMAAQDVGSFELDTIAPAVPALVQTVPGATNLSSLQLVGTGDAATDIVINDVVRTRVDESGNWSYHYPLNEGLNSLTIASRDAAGNDSAALAPLPGIISDTTPPDFTIAPYPAISAGESITIGGTIEAGAELELDGVSIVDQDGDPNDGSWVYTLSLAGTGLQERYVFAAMDAQQNRIERTVVLTYDAAAPAALAIGALSADGAGNGSQVTLSWPTYSEPLDLAYYRIYVASTDITDISALSAVGTVNRGTKIYTVSGLSAATSYYFAVEPIDGIGNSEKEVNSVSASPSDIVPPEEISNLKATASYTGVNANIVNLDWQASIDSAQDLADQVLYVDDGSGYDAGTLLGAAATSHQLGGLSDNQVYKFKIATRDSGGRESKGVYIQLTTALNNPTDLSAQPGKNKVALSWTAVDSPYLAIYKLYRQTAPFSDVESLSAFKGLTETGFVDTMLENGTAYYYAVTAVSSSGAEKTLVGSVEATPRQDETGPVIEAPVVLAAGGDIVLTENQVLSQPLTISVTASDFADESAMASVVILLDGVEVASGTSVASYFWNLVDAVDGSHSLKVIATDSVGNLSELSRTLLVSLAPPSSEPQQLGILTPVDGSTRNDATLTVTGRAPLFTDVTLQLNGLATATATVDAGGNFSFAGITLVPGTNSLAVMASHRGGDSSYSTPVKVIYDTGAPEAPRNFAAQVLPGGKLQFIWQAGSGEVPTGYNFYRSASPFSALDEPGVTKLNTEPLTYRFSEQLPAIDSPLFYAVSALDDSGNESLISNVVEVASDRSRPSIGVPDFVIANPGSGNQDDLVAGPGQLLVKVTLSEPLSENPFFSLEPVSGSPIVIALQQLEGTLDYSGSVQLSAASPHGTTSYNFSAKDLVGNRGIASGAGPVIDSRGPQASIGGLAELLEATGIVPLVVSFDEEPDRVPVLQLVDSQGVSVDVTLTQVDSLTWNGNLALDGLAAGSASFQLSGNLKDSFGNSSTSIVAGERVELYVGSPPAPAVPTALVAASRKDGEISLTWQGVAGASVYRIYRQPVASNDWGQPLAEVGSIFLDDTPPADGDYRYAVSAVGPLASESDLSAPVTAGSDRNPPEIPAGLTLSVDGNGVLANWDVVADAASYNLYRHDGAQPTALVANSTQLRIGDPAPNANPQNYVVTALDDQGNESLPSAPATATFNVAPPTSLTVSQSEGGKPELTWSGSGVGYYIYRNGSRINSDALNVTSYTDVYYSGGSVSYGVSLVDEDGFESPIRELTLPDLRIELPEGTSLRRGLLESIPLRLRSDTALTVAAVRLKVGSQPVSSMVGPFELAPDSDVMLSKVAVAGLDAQQSVGVLCTAVLNPAAGSSIEISQTSVAQVTGAGTVLELFNEPLVRGAETEVRLKLNNLGSARMDLLTSENGAATSKVRLFLKDQDGNILAQQSLNQRTGGQVVNSGAYATARIEPGETFLSDPVKLRVPETAPYRVIIEARIDASYYHYQQPEQVIAPGFRQLLTTTIADVSYRPLAQVDRLADASGRKSYTQGETVVIGGIASSTLDGSPIAYAPVRIGVAIDGFDRFFEVTSDENGQFSYDFEPGINGAGHYNVWASHPDLSDRSVQDSFDILAMRLSYSRYDLKIARAAAFDIPLELKNQGSTVLGGLTMNTSASDGLSAELINAGEAQLGSKEARKFSLRIHASAEAPAQGSASLKITADNGLSQQLTVDISCFDNIPIIATSPSFVEAGLVRATQQMRNFTIRNSGMASLENINLEAPSLPWIKLAISPFLGDLAVGGSASVGLLIQPGNGVAPGTYTDRVVIRSDNHIPYTYNLKVTVTSDAVGSVLFDVLNELNEDVAGATIVAQHQQQPELIYTLKTDASGTIVKADIPEGRYSYNISAPGHKSYGSNFTVYPGLQVLVPVALEVNLVEVEWSVTEVTIEDRYEIRIEQTFETNVPTAVIVVEPPVANLPLLEPGQVYNGEFTITNYGLISAKFKGLTFPDTFDDYSVEVLDNVPESLDAMQRVVVPYRITRAAAQ